MKNTVSAGGVVLNSRGQVLVIKQDYSTWSLPKGHTEQGESRMKAARREIYEESGIRTLEVVKKLGVYKRHKIGKGGKDDKSELKTIHIYLFETLEMKLSPVDENNPEARWVNKEVVTDLLTHEKDKEFYLSIIQLF